MITRVQFDEFRCLKNVDVPLKPLTVLIGPNDSGKTTFLQAIAPELDQMYPAQGPPSPDERVVARFAMEDSGSVTLVQARHWNGSRSRNLRSPMTLQFHPWIVEPSPHRLCFPDPIVRQDIHKCSFSAFMTRDGGGFNSLVHAYLCQDRSRFDSFVAQLRAFVPSIDDVHIEFDGSAQAILTFVVDGRKLRIGEMSTGVRLLAFYLAIALYPNPPRPLLIEEPENGVHPRRLKDLVKLFRSIVEGHDGIPASQVILTTHSPYLLDLIDPVKDQVLVFKHEKDGSRSVQPVDPDKWSELSKYFLLGEAWMNESESGLVGQATP